MPIAPAAVGVLVSCAILISLGLFVLLRDPRAPVNRLFGLSMCIVAGWIGSVSIALSANDLHTTIVIVRIAFAFASAIPFSLLCMFEAFRDSRLIATSFRMNLLGLTCVAFVLFSFSPWIVAGAQPGPLRPHFVYGPLHAFFGVY